MAWVQVFGADVADGRIQKLKVKVQRLPARTIDRDTAIRWMRDGHSLIPIGPAGPGAALQLVEADESTLVIRPDNERTPADAVPTLPSTTDARADVDVLPRRGH
jgi:hypothetical protein